MSVINQMLHDLENRRSQMLSTNNFSYHDLNFIPKLSNSSKFETIIYIVLFGVLLASAILYVSKVNTPAYETADSVISEKENTVSSKLADTSNKITPVASEQKNSQIKEPEHYAVATSAIRKQDKVVVKSIPVTKKVYANRSTVIEVKNNVEGVVHKRRRELTAPQKAENLYQSGYEYLLAKNTVAAQEELRNALMEMPGHNRSRELLTGIYIKSGRIVEARTLLQYGMRISPSHTIFAKLYARILMDQNDNVTAISVLLRNPPSQKVDSDYHALLAALYQKNKQHHKAATLYSQLLKYRQNQGVWWLGMAISLEALGNQEQARSAYEKAKNSGNLSKGLYQYTNQRVIALSEIAYP